MTTYTRGAFHVGFIRRIGAGGLGTVEEVKVTHSHGGPPVGTRLALKRLGPQWVNDPTARERFEREIELLSRMSHPNIVSLAGVSLSPTERFYVMPLYERSLRDWIGRASAAASPVEVARFGERLSEALRYAHDLGFIHRDLKPENILLRGHSDMVIADWGVGQFIHKTSKVLDLTVAGLGTEYYCSMEQWTTGRCDERGDIYSLGVLLAELAAGRRLPILPVGAGIRVDVVSAYTRGGPQLNAVLRKMTGAVPSMRYSSMAEVTWALNEVR
jgi:serine/threonine-protein kinase PpkA